MSWPKRNSRKGLMLQAQNLTSSLFREWRPHRGDWQPNEQLRRWTKLRIQALHLLLDEWEAKL